jgi:cellulase
LKERNEKNKMKTAAILLAAVTAVSAHSTWQQLWVGSTDKGTTCARTVKDNNPITGLTSADMFCGRSPASSSGVCEVAGMFLLNTLVPDLDG